MKKSELNYVYRSRNGAGHLFTDILVICPAAVSGSPMVMMDCPPVAAPDPPERIGSITWQHNTTQTSIDLDPNSPRYRQDPSNTFEITDIVPEDEGVYSCIFQIEGGSSPRSMTEVSSCIIVPGTVF